MKRIIFTQLFILLCAVAVLGQLKVYDHGDVHIGWSPTDPNPNGLPCLYMGVYEDKVTHPGYRNGEWGIEVLSGDLNFWKPWPSPFANDRNYYFHISKYGNVGIGKKASYKLDVNGDIATYGVLRIASDARLKSNIQTLSSQSNKIYQLNGVSYLKSIPEIDTEEINKMKNIPLNEKKVKAINQEKEFGFLAQELMKVYPELVTQDSEGYYAINYIGLIPVIIETLKEQKEEIESLKTPSLISIKKNAQQEPDVFSLNETIDNNVAALYQNIPNPFTQSTQIKYYLPETVTTAYLCFYNLQGTQLKQITLYNRGENAEIISGSQFSPGIYLYALIADGQEVDVKRMILTE